MTAELMRSAMRAKLASTAMAVTALCGANFAFAQQTKTEHDIFLVDVSGSMLTKPKDANKPSNIEIRRNLIQHWIQAHQNESVTLISFSNQISSPQTFNLANANERADAEKWVNEVGKTKPRGTNLWTCLRKALGIAREWTKQHPDDFVILHTLTDRS